MENKSATIQEITQIRQMMERSSRFVSLSGWSGIAAGCCALIGAGFAWPIVDARYTQGVNFTPNAGLILLLIGGLTFVAAFVSAFFFTWLRSRRDGAPVWSAAARRLMWSVAVPMIVGAVFVAKLIDVGAFGIIAPSCLIFYGLALFCGSKLTLGEIRYLGYAEILLGCITLWMPGHGFYFWVAGFGLLHILYGVWMWLKYERR